MKHCSGCNRDLTEHLFSPTASRCRECSRVYSRDHHRFTKYGLTPEGYALILKEQDGRCRICGTTKPGEVASTKYTQRKPSFRIDHDHVTGKVRGLLCHKCNAGLGMFGDNPERLITAASYLTNQV